jgi:hypothetical protein
MKAVVIIASWSSGSTAVTGYLDKCGAYSCPPHLNTIDKRTPNSYESIEYGTELAKLFDKYTFKEIGKSEDFVNFFEAWWAQECSKAEKLDCNSIVLKHPLQTFVLPYLKKKLNPSFIFVTRPFEEIGRTQIRRNWHPIMGEDGAKHIYSVAYNFFTLSSSPFISIPFNAFKTDAELRNKMLDFIGLSPSKKQIQSAESFLRKE